MGQRSEFDGSRKYQNLLLHVVGLVTAVTGVAILVSAFVEILTSREEVVTLLLLGTVITIVGSAAWSTTAIPKRIQVVDVFITVTGAWVVLAIVGALPYLLT